jgi:hypothetical protein
MARPMLLIGVGGFGKWVVTAFKTKIYDTYGGKKPEDMDIDWLSFDLTGDEKPEVKYIRFELGKLKEEKLDFSKTSDEFIQFEGKVDRIVNKVRSGKPDKRFQGRLTQDDANLIITSDEKGVPAGERRHFSMIPFVLDIEKIDHTIRNKLKANSIVFIVNSLAGGTGTGTFIDFHLLLRKYIRIRNGTLISIFLLPYGFKKVKLNEDMRPLYGNCYAGFREFLRLYYPKGNVRVNYSLTDLELQNITKKSELISDLVYIIDGSKIAGKEGSEIEYYNGVVPAIATFIENTFLAIKAEEEEKEAGTITETSFDNAKTHAQQNFLNKKIKEFSPYDAFSFSTFGAYRLIFDTEAVKIEFAQRIALKIFSEENFLAPSWITDPDGYVKNYLLSNESTQFDRKIIHECLTQQIPNFASFRSLKNRLEKDIKFPEFRLESIKPTGTVADTKGLIDARENARMGNRGDKYQAGRQNTFWAVRNWYFDFYTKEFEECIRKKVLEILDKGKDTENYGKGSLWAAEHFIGTLKDWYTDFLRGKGGKSKFTLACETADKTEGEKDKEEAKVDDYYKKNAQKKKGVFSDPRKEYINLRIKVNELKQREELRKLIEDIAEKNLEYLERLHQNLKDWIYTFDQCRKRMQASLNDLLEVRNAKKNIVCDEYLTESQDEIENKFFTLITQPKEWKRIKETKDIESLSELEKRIKEIIDNIPNPEWSYILKGFTWKFNLPEKENFSPRYPEGDLVCFVEAGMPEFPKREDWSREEYISTWNYKLVEYYLTHHRLNELDKITAFQILMLRGDDPKKVAEKLKEKSQIILSIDEGKLSTLKEEGYAPYSPEDHYYIIADFGVGENQEKLKKWVEEFEEAAKAFNAKSIPKKEKRHEIVFTTSKYSIPASAIHNLMNTKEEYLRRMKEGVPPPLHLFIGEKNAFRYEMKIAKIFGTSYEELHPTVVSVLEDEELVKDILLAKICAVIPSKFEDKTASDKQVKKCLTIKGKDFFAEGSDEPVYFIDVIYELLFPPEGKEEDYKNLVEDIKSELENKRITSEMIEKEINTLKENISAPDLPKKEKDLYKIWYIMLKELQK